MEHQLERRRVAGGGTALDAPRYLKLCVINELQILNDMALRIRNKELPLGKSFAYIRKGGSSFALLCQVRYSHNSVGLINKSPQSPQR